MRGRESPLMSDMMFVSLIHWSFLASVSRNSSVSKIQVTCTWFVICKVCCLHQYNLKEEKWTWIHAFFLQYPRAWTLLAPAVTAASPETWPRPFSSHLRLDTIHKCHNCFNNFEAHITYYDSKNKTQNGQLLRQSHVLHCTVSHLHHFKYLTCSILLVPANVL